jgi:hypothetical protein
MKRISIPIFLLTLLGVFLPVKAQAFDIGLAVNQLFKIDNTTSQSFMPGSISNTFGINAGGFNLNGLFSNSTLTALIPSSDFAKVLESIVQSNPSITASTLNGEIKNTIAKTVIASQGADSFEKNRKITDNAAKTSSLYTSNASQSYQSNLEAMQGLHGTMSEIGGGINTIQAQNIDIGKGLQVANELKAEQVTYQLSKDRVQDDVNSRATSLKYANARVNDIVPANTRKINSF